MTEASVGTKLRVAREEKNLSLEMVADKLKIRPSLVEALEADRFADLPEPIYTRAYLERYALVVGLDPAPLVSAFDRRAGFDVVQTVAVPRMKTLSSANRFSWVPVAIVLGAVALGAGGWWVWNTQFNRPRTSTSTAMANAARELAQRGTTGNNTLNAPSQGDPSVLLTVKLSVSSVPSGAAVLLDRFKVGVTPLKDAPVSGGRKRELRLERQGFKPFVQTIELTQNRNFSVNLERQPATPVVQPPTTPTDGNITLRFRGKSWIRVTNASNRVIFEGIPEAGSTQVFPAPITLRAGRPDVISASYNGSTRDRLGGANAATIRLP
jgi:cytoskeleton protein RodZ